MRSSDFKSRALAIAHADLEEVKKVQKDLWLMKRENQISIDNVWREYREEAESHQSGSFLGSLLFKRKSAYWMANSFGKQSLHDKRERKLAPLYEIRKQINHKLSVADNLISSTLNEIMQLEGDSSSSEAKYCTNCGKPFEPLSPIHRLCYQCYKKSIVGGTSETKLKSSSSNNTLSQKKCAKCGKLFTPRWSSHKFCYPCYVELKNR